jgi:hypothetical protein
MYSVINIYNTYVYSIVRTGNFSNFRFSIPVLMDEWTIKTPNSKCRLFFKIYLLMDFAALCLTDFIDWRYTHSWLVFSTQLVNCCLHARRNYTYVLLPLYLFSDLPPPPPLPKLKCTVHTDSVWLCGGWEGVELWCWTYVFCRSFTPDSEPTKLLHHPKENGHYRLHLGIGVFKLKFLRPCRYCKKHTRNARKCKIKDVKICCTSLH